MSVLVTGGAGYIGSHTVRALRDAGVDVVVLDSLEYGHRDAVIDAPLEVGDIADAALVRAAGAGLWRRLGRALRGVQGRGRVDGSCPSCTSRTMLAGARACSPRCKPPASTAWCSPRRVRCMERHARCPSTSNMPPDPRVPTARASASSSRCSTGSTNATACGASRSATSTLPEPRPTRRIGEDNPRPLNLVPLAMQAALGQLHVLPVNGTDYPTPDGTTIRDYVHVDDLAAAHVRALGYLEAGGESTIVNVGTGRGASTLEVIDGDQTRERCRLRHRGGTATPGRSHGGVCRQPPGA